MSRTKQDFPCGYMYTKHAHETNGFLLNRTVFTLGEVNV
jgi:hypothetical protein